MIKKKVATLKLSRETVRTLAGENLEIVDGAALRITVTGCTTTEGPTCLDC